ncbi:hypothetical protein MINTM021_11350 [Mycobacterium paraintracellulare]|nr:hypothetical protein MINTM021_11350 [Mycobacterium paraintracellulare]
MPPLPFDLRHTADSHIVEPNLRIRFKIFNIGFLGLHRVGTRSAPFCPWQRQRVQTVEAAAGELGSGQREQQPATDPSPAPVTSLMASV